MSSYGNERVGGERRRKSKKVTAQSEDTAHRRTRKEAETKR
jgi:hypothetical protein